MTAKGKPVFAVAYEEWKVGVLCDCCLAESHACPRKAQKQKEMQGNGSVDRVLESRSLDSFSIHCKPAIRRGS